MKSIKSICVYCGSADGANPLFVQAAREFGGLMAKKGITLVYGGAKVGIMGAVAEGVLSNNGKAVGIIPEFFYAYSEVPHDNLSEMIVVKSMHERKALMAERADAFVALPGGFGTLDELCEILTWAQLKLHEKPCVILNLESYYDPFLHFIEHAISQKLIKTEHQKLLRQAQSVHEIFDHLKV